MRKLIDNIIVGIKSIILVTLLVSCGGNRLDLPMNKPIAIGKLNKINVILDKNQFESPLADSIDYYFASAYPILPAPEPFFDLRFLTPGDLIGDPYKKELKTYLIVANLADTSSEATKMVRKDMGEEKFHKALKDSLFTLSIGKDKWAREQLLVYIFANGHDKLADALKTNFPAVAKRINKHDEKALEAAIYGAAGQNAALSNQIKEKFGLNIQIPSLFVQAMEEDNFLWIRLDHKDVIENLVFRKFKYENQEQFSKEHIINLRNEYGKQFIKTSSVDAYMSTNEIDLPIYKYTESINGIYTTEVRGIWEIVNDFMGGPFISYLLHNEKQNEVIFIDAFVFAPGKDKRDYMQKLDFVVKHSKIE